MYELYLKIKNWYSTLPWYFKVLGFFIPIIIFVMYLLTITNKTSVNTDELMQELTDTKLNNLEKKEKEIRTQIIEKKKEIAKQINSAQIIDNEALKRREEITKATTMKELDEIQEKYNL